MARNKHCKRCCSGRPGCVRGRFPGEGERGNQHYISFQPAGRVQAAVTYIRGLD